MCVCMPISIGWIPPSVVAPMCALIIRNLRVGLPPLIFKHDTAGSWSECTLSSPFSLPFSDSCFLLRIFCVSPVWSHWFSSRLIVSMSRRGWSPVSGWKTSVCWLPTTYSWGMYLCVLVCVCMSDMRLSICGHFFNYCDMCWGLNKQNGKAEEELAGLRRKSATSVNDFPQLRKRL